MTWTYNASPWNYDTNANFVSGSPLDTVRFLIGDTDTTDQQLQDTEIAGQLSQEGAPLTSPTGTFALAASTTRYVVNASSTAPVYRAAVACCRMLSARYTRRANKTVGDLSIQYSSIAKSYIDLAGSLTTELQRHAAAAPYVGGISISDKETDQGDDDLVQPTFAKGFMDDPGTAPDAGVSNSDPFDGFDRLTPGG